MPSVLHHLGPFSPVEDIQALIDELRARGAEAYANDIAFLEDMLDFAKTLEE